MRNLFGSYALMTAQQAYDQRLAAKCTRNKYTPDSVKTALTRRVKMIRKGYGRHKTTLPIQVANIINGMFR